MAGTYEEGNAILWRDGVKVFEQARLDPIIPPKLLALGGSDANDHFSQSEVAEVLFFSQALNPSELAAMQVSPRQMAGRRSV